MCSHKYEGKTNGKINKKGVNRMNKIEIDFTVSIPVAFLFGFGNIFTWQYFKEFPLWKKILSIILAIVMTVVLSTVTELHFLVYLLILVLWAFPISIFIWINWLWILLAGVVLGGIILWASTQN